MFQRLQPDFQLGIVLIYGCCAVTLVSCFAVYRFMTGSIPGGLLDLGLVVGIACMVLYGWRSGKVELAGRFLVLFNIIGTVLSTILLGDTGLYWVFVSISVNFFLTQSTWFATASNVLMLMAVILLSQGFTNHVTLWTFLSTGSMLTLLSAIVSRQNRLQQQRLQHLSITDPLTGAYNRRNMEQELQLSVEEYRRSGTTMCLLLFDLDHFKAINDNYGHDKGDDVLLTFSELVSANTRKVDRFFRFGGEEFLMLLKGASLDQALAIAEKIRAATENNPAMPSVSVTVSIGVAALGPEENWEQWLARADAAMYKAKQFGRNRIEC
jgi:diguanylate cyclase (GGDEF)-like protein